MCMSYQGGPLITSEGVQVGIVSLGPRCASVHFAGIYARVSSAAEFIQDGICSLSANPPRSC